MPKYRKKPVVIEAIQWDGSISSADVIEEWSNGATDCHGYPIAIHIKTLEGEMCADKDDWIIKGVKGEYYPCKPDIFVATYEKVEDIPPPPKPSKPFPR